MTDLPLAVIEAICLFVILGCVITALAAGCRLYAAIRRLRQ